MKIIALHSEIRKYLNIHQYRAIFVFREKDTIEIIDVNNHYK